MNALHAARMVSIDVLHSTIVRLLVLQMVRTLRDNLKAPPVCRGTKETKSQTRNPSPHRRWHAGRCVGPPSRPPTAAPPADPPSDVLRRDHLSLGGCFCPNCSNLSAIFAILNAATTAAAAAAAFCAMASSMVLVPSVVWRVAVCRPRPAASAPCCPILTACCSTVACGGWGGVSGGAIWPWPLTPMQLKMESFDRSSPEYAWYTSSTVAASNTAGKSRMHGSCFCGTADDWMCVSSPSQ
mmetsp:Transcript_31341/g.68506  ORF Transcript_31341/g.68506 Transcript_31341/m.68506 type:complete len:240 (+) Transcript_31341:218-937(+)